MSNPLSNVDYRDKLGNCSATDQEPLDQCRNHMPDNIPGHCKYRMPNGVCVRPFVIVRERDEA